FLGLPLRFATVVIADQWPRAPRPLCGRRPAAAWGSPASNVPGPPASKAAEHSPSANFQKLGSDDPPTESDDSSAAREFRRLTDPPTTETSVVIERNHAVGPFAAS